MVPAMSPHQFQLTSRQCPVCSAVAVEAMDDSVGDKRRLSHRYTSCGALLKSVATVKMLWAMPVAALSVSGVVLLRSWLMQEQVLSDFGITGVTGGLTGIFAVVSARSIWRGLVLQPWKP